MKRSPRRLFAFRGFAAARLAVAIALFAALSGAAFAQGYDCAGQRAQIAGLDRSNARANPYAGTIRSQRAGLQRTADYAHKIGCDRQQFIFFGSPPPAQWRPDQRADRAIAGQPRATRRQRPRHARFAAAPADGRQLQRLLPSADGNAGAASSAACSAAPRSRATSPISPTFPRPMRLPATDQPGQPTGGSEMLCVRHCDGAFFPITDAPGRDQETLSDFCKASCPNAEVSVYSRVPGQVIQTAVGLDGKAYMSLPAALKYQKSLDASCTCRAQGATWGDTLAGAEAMLSHSKKGEFVVTQEKSDEMARPTAATPDKKKKRAPVPAADDTSDQDIIDQDAAAAAQVPTASTDSAGISAGDVKNQSSYPQGAGQTTEITTPEGVKQRVRIVGPQP